MNKKFFYYYVSLNCQHNNVNVKKRLMSYKPTTNERNHSPSISSLNFASSSFMAGMLSELPNRLFSFDAISFGLFTIAPAAFWVAYEPEHNIKSLHLEVRLTDHSYSRMKICFHAPCAVNFSAFSSKERSSSSACGHLLHDLNHFLLKYLVSELLRKSIFGSTQSIFNR